MTREIKFRAWDKIENSMQYSWSYTMPNADSVANTLSMFFVWWQFNTDCPLMQYTGLKDKNGKEIYEGDLLKYVNGDIGDIVWIPQEARYQIATRPYWGTIDFTPEETDTMYEVIGNIYENPELLTS